MRRKQALVLTLVSGSLMVYPLLSLPTMLDFAQRVMNPATVQAIVAHVQGKAHEEVSDRLAGLPQMAGRLQEVGEEFTEHALSFVLLPTGTEGGALLADFSLAGGSSSATTTSEFSGHLAQNVANAPSIDLPKLVANLPLMEQERRAASPGGQRCNEDSDDTRGTQPSAQCSPETDNPTGDVLDSRDPTSAPESPHLPLHPTAPEAQPNAAPQPVADIGLVQQVALIPEPPTWMLLGFAALLALLQRRR